jgi:hypothetical protein
MRRLMRSWLSGMVVAAAAGVAIGASAQSAEAMTGVAPAAAVPRFSAPAVSSIPEDAGDESIVAADFNGDGTSDLAMPDDPIILVLLGKGNGAFHRPAEYRVGFGLGDLTVADLNGDGRPDIAARGGRGVSVLLNDGAGRFPHHTSFAAPGTAVALAAADVNLDGKVDLLTANLRSQELSVFVGQGAGHFGPARTFSGLGAGALAVGDINGDGRPDVALSGVIVRPNRLVPGPVSVRLGRGDGTFGPDQAVAGVHSGPQTVTLTDLNPDGKLDLLVQPVRGRASFVLLGKGDGTFAPPSSVTFGRRQPLFTLVADFNMDGGPDIAADRPDAAMVVAAGRGDGSFGRQQPLSGDPGVGSGAVGDFNGDGRPDLASVEEAACDSTMEGCFRQDTVNHLVTWLNWTGLPAPPCMPPDLERFVPTRNSERTGLFARIRLRRAKRDLKASGCRVGHVRRRVSREDRNVVIAQRPRTGAVLPSHARVDLVVSRGRRR